jgi:putative SOS response-associated peptidase YedK
VDTLKTFADAFAHRRGILMVATFNEGQEVGKRTKQWTVTPNDALPIAIAVICEQWTNGNEVLDTFVMVTTPPNALIARITDRTAILRREAWAAWLGETNRALADVKTLLQTFDDGGGWSMEPQELSRAARAAKPNPSSAQGSLF